MPTNTTQALGFASGSNIFHDTANANTAVVVKGSSGTLDLIVVDNTLNGAASFLRLFDSTSSITVGTTVPDWVFKVPASSIVSFLFPGGEAFGTGLQACTVTAGGTVGNTSPSSNVDVKIAYR